MIGDVAYIAPLLDALCVLLALYAIVLLVGGFVVLNRAQDILPRPHGTAIPEEGTSRARRGTESAPEGETT